MRNRELDMNTVCIGSDEDDDEEEDQRILEWEEGLPADADLTPLSQLLIPPELASAFRIPPEPPRTALDAQRASHNSVSAVLPLPVPPIAVDDDPEEPTDEAGDTMGGDETASSHASKRPRLVWTPQLHKRFVEVVAHLGLKNAVPKTIMQLMNVEGLSRENVASHLQKYRLYVKRMQGISDDGPLPPTGATAVPYGIYGENRFTGGSFGDYALR